MKKHRAVRLFALLFALILASALLCSLASCGKDKETETPVGLIAIY